MQYEATPSTIRYVERSNDLGSGTGDEAGASLRVLLVQDHPLLASTLALILESASGLTVSGIVRTGHDAAEAAARDEVSVVLLDFALRDTTGPDAARLIIAAAPAAAIVVLASDDSDNELLDAIEAGATSYLPRSSTPDDIVTAVKRAAVGDLQVPARLLARVHARRRDLALKAEERRKAVHRLTPREIDILQLLAEGLDANTMSHRLDISLHTVEWHIRNVIEKLQVHSKLQAVIAAARLGLINL